MFRLATPEDSQQLAALAQEAYGKYLDLVVEPPVPMLLDYAAVAAAGQTYVAELDDGIHGMVTIERQDPDLILRNLAVRPRTQRTGLGRRFVALVEDIARRDGLVAVRLWTRAEMVDNIAFYSKLNYVITHTERTPEATRVFFRKPLDGAPVPRTSKHSTEWSPRSELRFETGR